MKKELKANELRLNYNKNIKKIEAKMAARQEVDTVVDKTNEDIPSEKTEPTPIREVPKIKTKKKKAKKKSQPIIKETKPIKEEVVISPKPKVIFPTSDFYIVIFVLHKVHCDAWKQFRYY